MNKGDLFDDGPCLLKCDGCERYFEEQFIKQCRACGKLYCPNCREAHDCRKTTSTPSKASVPNQSSSSPVHINVQPAKPRPKQVPIATPRTPVYTENSNPQKAKHSGRLTFLDDEKCSIGSADIRRNKAPKISEVYSNQTIKVSEPRTDLSQPLYQDPLIPPLEKPIHHPTDIVQQDKTVGVTIDNLLECAPDELICDNCNKPWKKMHMRKCKKCGAVLCPDCRKNHKCKKQQKKFMLRNPLHR